MPLLTKSVAVQLQSIYICSQPKVILKFSIEGQGKAQMGIDENPDHATSCGNQSLSSKSDKLGVLLLFETM